MRFLTISLCGLLSLILPFGFITASALILDKPLAILIVGFVFGLAATYALSIVTERRESNRLPSSLGRGTGLPVAATVIPIFLMSCGLYVYWAELPQYLRYKDIPQLAAAMLFVPGVLVGCGAILAVLAGRNLRRQPA